MTISKNILAGSGAVAAAYEIEQSLMFDKTQGHGLRRTETSSGNRRTWTLSCWVKQATVDNTAFMIWGQAQSHFSNLTMQSQVLVWNEYNGGNPIRLHTKRIFRDPSAWYHIVLRLDTTQSTASDRARIYVNGVQQTDFSIESYPSANHEGRINDHTFDSGYNYVGNGYFNINQTGYGWNGYIAEMNFIDGASLDASSFGETNSDTDQWVPKKYEGSYGSKGYYLPFSKNGNGGSAYLDGSGDRLTTPSSSDFAFGTGDFTIEGWYYLTASFASGNQYLFDFGSNGLRVQFYNGTVYYIVDGSNNVTTTASGVTHNNWYHIAAVRYNSQMNLYIDGVSRGTKDSVTTNLSAQALTIGAYGANGSNALHGYISNFRVSNSAIYTSNFTPSTTPLTNLSSTKFLMNGGNSAIVGPALTGIDDTTFSVFQPFASSVTTFASDTSGNGNNYTSFNLNNANVIGDSPTNNFATWNPNIRTPYYAVSYTHLTLPTIYSV